jgi:lysophospholipase L1-like esterase
MLGTTEPFVDPEIADENILIQQYNDAIVQLRLDNALPTFPPDFYNHFRDNYLNDGGSQYADNIHPNGVGYQQMAQLWSVELLP